MEGGGGMVAIIQGLQDAGLAVTVVKARYQDGLYKDDRFRASIMGPREKCLSPVKSVETNTQGHQTTQMAQQLCEDRYTSSYQVAHCSIRPLSPPVHKSEFPVQGPQLSRIEGTFVSQSAGQGTPAEVQIPVRDSQSYGNSFTWPSRGIQSTISSRANEAFAESLRRYPLPPEQTSDYVGRLLAFTQAKNALKISKSPRPLKDKIMDPFNDIKIKTKNIQTYTRTNNEKDNDSAIKNMKFSCNGQQTKKRGRIHSPVNYKKIKYKDNQLNETYDYLKSTSPTRYGTATEARYLEEVSRCIKDSIRKMLDDKPVECPRVQSRYSQHIREHHPRSHRQQASCISTCPNHPSICRFCEKPLPCICTVPAPRNQVENTAALEETQTNQLWKQEIFSWLQEVPVYANITPKDEERRRNNIKDLTNTLIEMRNNKDFETKAKDVVKKYLNNLPMWTPTTKSEQEIFRKQIADNLIDRLKTLTEEHGTIDELKFKDNRKLIAEKDKIINTDIPKETTKVVTENKEKNINKLSVSSPNKRKTITSVNLQDGFEKEILDWFQDIPELSKNSVADIQENKKYIRNLAEKLQEPQYKEIYDETIQELMRYVIKDWLETMMKKDNGSMNFKTKEKLSQKLMEKLISAAKYADTAIRRTSSIEGDLNNEYLQQILSWLQDIPELSSGKESKNQEVTELAIRLQNLHSEGIEDEEKIRHEIFNWLVKEAEKKGIQWDTKTQNQLSSNLAAKIRKLLAPRCQTASSFKDSVNENYLEEIWDWIKEIPELAKGSKSARQSMVQSLATQLQNLYSEGIDDEDKIQNEVSNWLVKEVEKRRAKVSPEIQEQLTNKLTAKIKNIFRQKQETGPEDNTNKYYLEQIYDWFKHVPDLAKSSQSENYKTIHFLATQLQNLHSNGIEDEEEIRNLVSNWLTNESEKSGTKISYQSQNELANKLIAKIKNISALKQKTGVTNRINEDYLEQFYVRLADILELAKSSKFEAQKMIESLTRQLENLLFEGVEDEGVHKEISNWRIDELEKIDEKFISESQNQLTDQLVDKMKSTLGSGSEKNNTLLKRRKHWDDICHKETGNSLISAGKIIPPSHSPIDLLSIDIKKSNKEKKINISEGSQAQHSNKINSNLADILHDQDQTSDNENTIKKHASSVLKEADVSDKNDNDFDYTALGEITPLPSELTLAQKQALRDSIEKIILDFVDKITDNQTSLSREKIREETAKLARKLSNILAKSDIVIKEKESIIFNEVSEFLKRLSLTQKDKVPKVIERIQNISLITSTPRGYKLDSDFSCFPKPNITSIPATKHDENFVTQSKEEAKFVANLITAIQKWILELPIDWAKNKSLMDSILIELAEEIAERQKYLDTHSHSKPSEEEELEHLKYQVFRCLNKALDESNLLLVMSKVESLMSTIRNIYVPQLSRSTSHDLNNAATTVSKFADALNDNKSKSLGDNFESFMTPNVQEKGVNLTNALREKIQKWRNTDEDIENEILEWISSILKNSNDVEATALGEDLRGKLKDKSFTDKSNWAGLSQGSGFIIENLKEAILDFLRSLPFQEKRNEVKLLQKQLSAELANSLQKLLASGLETHKADFDTLIVNQIYDYLKKFSMEPAERGDDSFLLKLAQQLLEHLKRLQLFQHILPRNVRSLEGPSIVHADDSFSLPTNTKTYTEKLHSNILKEKLKKNLQAFLREIFKWSELSIDKKVEQLSEKLQPILSSNAGKSKISHDLITDVIFNWSQNIPLQMEKTTNDISNALNSFSKNVINILSTAVAFNNKSKLQEETMKFLRQLPIQIDKIDDIYLHSLVELLINKINESAEAVLTPKLMTNATDTLYSEIKNCCNDLAIASGSTVEEIERVKMIKHNLASKLANKFVQLNMNPETVHDDILFEDLMQDEIDNLFTTFLPSPELVSNLAVVKGNLMEKIRKAKYKIEDELAGQTREKQLCEAKLKTLSSYNTSVSEEDVSFEDLKNNFAEAYVNFYYSAIDKEQKNKIKKNIADGIESFSNNYLQRHPDTPLDTKKNYKYVYSVNKTSVPRDETIVSEVAQIRIKDEINDWIKEVSLNDESAAAKLQREKNVVVLANRLYELEKKIDMDPESDIHNEMKKEISKWLKTLPLRAGEGNVNQMTDKLMNKLKSIERARGINTSTTVKSIEDDKIDSSQIYRHSSANCLTVNDRAQMGKIQQQNIAYKNQPHDYRDASVSPLPIDASIQTEVSKDSSETYPQISSHTQPCPEADSKSEVSPKVIVKEYFWGTSNSNLNEFVYRIPCLLNPPCYNTQLRTTPSYITVTCPKSTSVSCEPKSPTQISLGPIITNKPLLPKQSSAIQRQVCKPCTQKPQNNSLDMFQQENPYPPSNSKLLPPLQRSHLQAPCPGSLNQIRPNCTASQQCPSFETGRQIATQEPTQGIPPSPPCLLSSAPCMPSSVIGMPPSTSSVPPKPFRSPEVTRWTAPRQISMKRNKNLPFKQLCTHDMSEDPQVEPHIPEVGPSNCQERATKLGSLDNRGRQPHVKISIGVPADSSKQVTVSLPDNIKWDTPCYRPKIYKIPYENSNGKNVSATLKREQKMRCGYKNRSVTRRSCDHHSNCQSCESLRRCAKCYGMSCPHPSGLYFS